MNHKEVFEKAKRLYKENHTKPIPKFKVGDKIYLKPEYRMPLDDTPIVNTIQEIKEIDEEHYHFNGAFVFIEDQDKFELVGQKTEFGGEYEEIKKTIIKAYEDELEKITTRINQTKYPDCNSEDDIEDQKILQYIVSWLKSQEIASFKGTVRDGHFIDFDNYGTSWIIPSNNIRLSNGDKVVVKIEKEDI